jgi:hypothetical protein
MMHSSRAMLALNGTLMAVLGGAFWLLPEFFTLTMFPGIEQNEVAMSVGISLRKNMGVGCVFIGVILFSCQESSKAIAQRLFYSSVFGFFLMFIALLQVRVSEQAQVPIFMLIFFATLMLLSLFVASRRFQE